MEDFSFAAVSSFRIQMLLLVALDSSLETVRIKGADPWKRFLNLSTTSFEIQMLLSVALDYSLVVVIKTALCRFIYITSCF